MSGIIRCAKVGAGEGIEINIIVDRELCHSSKKGSYIRVLMREKNLIKSREIEMRLSVCLQEDEDNTMATNNLKYYKLNKVQLSDLYLLFF